MNNDQFGQLRHEIGEVKTDLHRRMDNLESNVERYRTAAESRCSKQTEHVNDELRQINRELGEISAGLGLKANRDDVTQTRISLMRHQQQEIRELVKADQFSKAQWIKIVFIILGAIASAFGIQFTI